MRGRWVLSALTVMLGACSSPPPAGIADTTSTSPIDTTVVATTAAPATTAPVATSLSAPTGGTTGGAAGIGDPYFPNLGNGGYDIEQYHLDLTWDEASGGLAGSVTIEATAEQRLSSFHLDLEGMTVRRVTVDDVDAGFESMPHELEVVPAAPVEEGAEFVAVVDYEGVPLAEGGGSGALGGALGWQASDDGAFVMGEPDGAATWFPCNDHPADKALITLRLTVPTPYSVAASGTLRPVEEVEGGRAFTWETTQPLAPYMLALGIGEWVEVEEEGPVPLRSFFDPDLTDSDRALFDRQGEMLEHFTALFGPYPFEAYGVLVVDDLFPPAALETQTLSTFSRSSLGFGENVVAHELAHQWFGDSVSLTRWEDIWLHEGFATYAEWLWTEHDLGEGALEESVRFAYGAISGTTAVEGGADPEQVAAELPDVFPPPGDPGADDLFNPSVYLRGGLTLHVLRSEVGDPSFFDTLRTYADRFRYGNATTPDFVAVAEEVAGQQLDGLFDAWLYDEIVPAIPEMGLEPVRPG